MPVRLNAATSSSGVGCGFTWITVAPNLAAVVVTLFVMGLAAFAFIATANSTLQLTARSEMRGRVMALYAIAFLGTTPIGSPLVGWIARDAGITATTMAAVMAGCAVVGVLSLWLIVRPRTVERLTP